MNFNIDDSYKKSLDSIKIRMNQLICSLKVKNHRNENFIVSDESILGSMNVSNKVLLPQDEDVITSLDDRKVRIIMSDFALLLDQGVALKGITEMSDDDERAMMLWPQWIIDGEFNTDFFQSCHALLGSRLSSLTPEIVGIFRSMECFKDKGKFNVKFFQEMCLKYMKEKIHKHSNVALQAASSVQALPASQEKALFGPGGEKKWQEWIIDGMFNRRFYEHVCKLCFMKKIPLTQSLVRSILKTKCYERNNRFDLDKFCEIVNLYPQNLSEHQYIEDENDDIMSWPELHIHNKYSEKLFKHMCIYLSSLDLGLTQNYIMLVRSMSMFNIQEEFDLELFCRCSIACKENENQIQTKEDLVEFLMNFHLENLAKLSSQSETSTSRIPQNDKD